MPINSYKMGPGTLELGSGPLDVSMQVTSFTVEASEKVTEEDDIDVLSGDVLEGVDEVSYDYRVKGTLLQDLAAAGVVAWSWTNKGTSQAFTFIPSTAADRQVTGFLRPVPLKIGGDAKVRAVSEVDWACIGEPDFEAVP